MGKTYFNKRNDFSESHYKLPFSYGMFDLDIFKGEWLQLSDNIAANNEATYVEYRCLKFDKDDNKFNIDRIKFVAIFELKHKLTDRVKEEMNLNAGKPLWGVFMLAKILKTRFFLVITNEGNSPFHFFEYNTITNMRLEQKALYFNYERDDAKIINEFWNNELNIK